MASTLGIAVIGQVPRLQTLEFYKAAVPAGTRLIMRGCMDGLDDDALRKVEPIDGDDTLYTGLPSGREIRLSKHAVVERAPAVLAALRADGANTIVFNCTGEFPPMAGDAGVLFPSRLLNGIAGSLLQNGGRLGILVPLAEQAHKLSQKWAPISDHMIAETLVPTADPAAAAAVAAKLRDQGCDVIAMDCMSYTPALKHVVREVTGVPTILAITAVGRVIAELME